MKCLLSLFLLFMFSFGHAQTVQSPSGTIALNFKLAGNGQPAYSVNYKNKAVVLESLLGIKLKEKPDLDTNFEILTSKTSSFSESWKPVLGEQTSIQNQYNELNVSLINKETKVKINIIFRVFDEGVAFRYDFPRQAELNYFIISDEVTQFNLTENNKVFWIPGDFDSNEYEYNETKFSEIDNSKINMNNGIGVKSIPGKYMVQTPLMMKAPSGLYLNIFEAAVVNYPVMHLNADVTNYKLKAELVPNAIGDKAYLQTPCVSPWRTIMISDDARDIVASKMILNLNEPSKLDDTSWIKPMKYVGIWWEMHVGKSTWDYAGSQNATNFADAPKASGKHGATTENTKRYIDFAAKNGFGGVLVEGWNVGWEDWNGNWKEEVFDFTTPYPDFDIAAISAYAKAKNVQMIMHHETSGSVSNYERHLDRAFDLMKKHEYPAVKTGYVGKIIPRGEFHDGQSMVNHFNFVVRRAADYKIMINSHESSRPTGYGRTYPNYIAAEAARGNEFNAWSVGNPPMHETILPFTRQLGGPMDYTPGIFEIKMSYYDKNKTEQVHTTLAKQLALYVTMYSPLQMAADLLENYEKYPDAFQFVKDVETDWDESKYLEAEPGDYVTVARKTKGKETWFLGAITDENARKSEIKLDFLTKGMKYKAIIYEDAKDADWKKNPIAYKIRTITVTSKSKIKLNLAPGGGTAISFEPIK
ncbi:glycoside hydrolase family 97 protein [Flavobacterium sp. GSP27]|uniref:glycoside hydrolase family 97 protein n=1 Tax=unclassified Flavobacterium TaxID=196869 RepID=UPI000F81CA6D|nr:MULTISPECIES: glycoside hydrolase family 97 protein [unclassified Flavobacterium]RTY90773.1 glycoside hydrolase family 97 protein [Flavobacterium sp. RSP46]RTY94599.1 glycoside hydrolase family 97 protein [Flavobacterium sp. GSN2]RTZ10460.1 glycoside hydrolase family 97 protein [Flavobacterium sp. GSP27]